MMPAKHPGLDPLQEWAKLNGIALTEDRARQTIDMPGWTYEQSVLLVCGIDPDLLRKRIEKGMAGSPMPLLAKNYMEFVALVLQGHFAGTGGQEGGPLHV